MLKNKKIVATILTVAMAMCMSFSAFAAEPNNELYNVSTEAPEASTEDIVVFGLSKPSTDKVVDLNNESLSFSGQANGSTLYTNKNFTGKSTIGYSITNKCDTDLTVKFYASGIGLISSKKIVVAANATLTGTIDGLDADELYYLTFSAPSDFKGSVY